MKKSILFFLSVCLFSSIKCEAACSIRDRADLDTHLAAYFSDPNAIHACGDISTWNVSNVTDFTDLFYNQATFNANISNWDTSSVTTLKSTFQSASAFTGDVLSNWDTSSVTSMELTFYEAGVSSWDTSSVTTLSGTFQGATSFTGDGVIP